MSQSQWQALSSKEYQLLGDIDRDSVPAIWCILEKWQTTESIVEIDLSHINRVASAGMVMLIHLFTVTIVNHYIYIMHLLRPVFVVSRQGVFCLKTCILNITERLILII